MSCNETDAEIPFDEDGSTTSKLTQRCSSGAHKDTSVQNSHLLRKKSETSVGEIDSAMSDENQDISNVVDKGVRVEKSVDGNHKKKHRRKSNDKKSSSGDRGRSVSEKQRGRRSESKRGSSSRAYHDISLLKEQLGALRKERSRAETVKARSNKEALTHTPHHRTVMRDRNKGTMTYEDGISVITNATDTELQRKREAQTRRYLSAVSPSPVARLREGISAKDDYSIASTPIQECRGRDITGCYTIGDEDDVATLGAVSMSAMSNMKQSACSRARSLSRMSKPPRSIKGVHSAQHTFSDAVEDRIRAIQSPNRRKTFGGQGTKRAEILVRERDANNALQLYKQDILPGDDNMVVAQEDEHGNLYGPNDTMLDDLKSEFRSNKDNDMDGNGCDLQHTTEQSSVCDIYKEDTSSPDAITKVMVRSPSLTHQFKGDLPQRSLSSMRDSDYADVKQRPRLNFRGSGYSESVMNKRSQSCIRTRPNTSGNNGQWMSIEKGSRRISFDGLKHSSSSSVVSEECTASVRDLCRAFGGSVPRSTTPHRRARSKSKPRNSPTVRDGSTIVPAVVSLKGDMASHKLQLRQQQEQLQQLLLKQEHRKMEIKKEKEMEELMEQQEKHNMHMYSVQKEQFHHSLKCHQQHIQEMQQFHQFHQSYHNMSTNDVRDSQLQHALMNHNMTLQTNQSSVTDGHRTKTSNPFSEFNQLSPVDDEKARLSTQALNGQFQQYSNNMTYRGVHVLGSDTQNKDSAPLRMFNQVEQGPEIKTAGMKPISELDMQQLIERETERRVAENAKMAVSKLEEKEDIPLTIKTGVLSRSANEHLNTIGTHNTLEMDPHAVTMHGSSTGIAKSIQESADPPSNNLDKDGGTTPVLMSEKDLKHLIDREVEKQLGQFLKNTVNDHVQKRDNGDEDYELTSPNVPKHQQPSSNNSVVSEGNGTVKTSVKDLCRAFGGFVAKPSISQNTSKRRSQSPTRPSSSQNQSLYHRQYQQHHVKPKQEQTVNSQMKPDACSSMYDNDNSTIASYDTFDTTTTTPKFRNDTRNSGSSVGNCKPRTLNRHTSYAGTDEYVGDSDMASEDHGKVVVPKIEMQQLIDREVEKRLGDCMKRVHEEYGAKLSQMEAKMKADLQRMQNCFNMAFEGAGTSIPYDVGFVTPDH